MASEDDAQLIFRRHFEAQFKPLPDVMTATKPQVTQTESDDDGSDESDWNGISDDEIPASDKVEVTEHTTMESPAILSKSERRALMSSKPPALMPPSSVATSKGRKRSKPAENDASEIANMHMDVALQRLLAESHLLDKSTLVATGINRHKVTDLRTQKLGAKTSIFDQANMPKSHRIGMIAKSAEREAKRRREAKECGVILELPKEKKRTVHRNGKRGMNVSMPGVGSFAGATLRLSKKDINDIEGPKESFGGERRGRGGGKRR